MKSEPWSCLDLGNLLDTRACSLCLPNDRICFCSDQLSCYRGTVPRLSRITVERRHNMVEFVRDEF